MFCDVAVEMPLFVRSNMKNRVCLQLFVNRANDTKINNTSNESEIVEFIDNEKVINYIN
jgi:hypothetical protein